MLQDSTGPLMAAICAGVKPSDGREQRLLLLPPFLCLAPRPMRFFCIASYSNSFIFHRLLAYIYDMIAERGRDLCPVCTPELLRPRIGSAQG